MCCYSGGLLGRCGMGETWLGQTRHVVNQDRFVLWQGEVYIMLVGRLRVSAQKCFYGRGCVGEGSRESCTQLDNHNSLYLHVK